MVFEYLDKRDAFGESAAITATDLVRQLGIASVRELREIIQHERLDGNQIVSSNKGYYLPLNSGDIEVCVKRLRGQAGAINHVADALERGGNAKIQKAESPKH